MTWSSLWGILDVEGTGVKVFFSNSYCIILRRCIDYYNLYAGLFSDSTKRIYFHCYWLLLLLTISILVFSHIICFFFFFFFFLLPNTAYICSSFDFHLMFQHQIFHWTAGKLRFFFKKKFTTKKKYSQINRNLSKQGAHALISFICYDAGNCLYFSCHLRLWLVLPVCTNGFRIVLLIYSHSLIHSIFYLTRAIYYYPVVPLTVFDFTIFFNISFSCFLMKFLFLSFLFI